MPRPGPFTRRTVVAGLACVTLLSVSLPADAAPVPPEERPTFIPNRTQLLAKVRSRADDAAMWLRAAGRGLAEAERLRAEEPSQTRAIALAERNVRIDAGLASKAAFEALLAGVLYKHRFPPIDPDPAERSADRRAWLALVEADRLEVAEAVAASDAVNRRARALLQSMGGASTADLVEEEYTGEPGEEVEPDDGAPAPAAPPSRPAKKLIGQARTLVRNATSQVRAAEKPFATGPEIKAAASLVQSLTAQVEELLAQAAAAGPNEAQLTDMAKLLETVRGHAATTAPLIPAAESAIALDKVHHPAERVRSVVQQAAANLSARDRGLAARNVATAIDVLLDQVLPAMAELLAMRPAVTEGAVRAARDDVGKAVASLGSQALADLVPLDRWITMQGDLLIAGFEAPAVSPRNPQDIPRDPEETPPTGTPPAAGTPPDRGGPPPAPAGGDQAAARAPAARFHLAPRAEPRPAQVPPVAPALLPPPAATVGLTLPWAPVTLTPPFDATAPATSAPAPAPVVEPEVTGLETSPVPELSAREAALFGAGLAAEPSREEPVPAPDHPPLVPVPGPAWVLDLAR